MKNTQEQYNAVVSECSQIFLAKNKEYGASWRVYRSTSMTDKIYIKAKRIRTLQETKKNKVGESIESELKAILNYCMCAMVLLETDLSAATDEKALERYEHYLKETGLLMQKKNHDYGEAWRDMRISSMTDEILVKLSRIKTMEQSPSTIQDNDNLMSNYQDIANYAVFCLIRISEGADALS